MEEIICHARVVRKIHILSRGRYQFTSDVQFDIYIDVRVVIGRYKKFQIILIDGAIGLYATSVVPSTDFCIGLCAKMSNLLLTDAISAADMIAAEE